MEYGAIVEGLWALMPYTGVKLYFVYSYHYGKQEIPDVTGKSSNDRRHDIAGCCSYGLKVLTALHLIALLCGGRVAHDGRLMVESLGSD